MSEGIWLQSDHFGFSAANARRRLRRTCNLLDGDHSDHQMNKVVPFDRLTSCDLDVDANYEGGMKGNTGDDPINRLVAGGNQGGF